MKDIAGLRSPDELTSRSNRLSIDPIYVLAALIYVFFSNAFTGQNLHVWGDEITYSIESRHLDYANATYPIYLYLKLFNIAHGAGTGFLESARSINAALLTVAAIFIYKTARHYADRNWSCLTTVISTFAPISTYSAYFMPDTMYFCGVSIFSWLYLTKPDGKNGSKSLLCGSILGLLSLVKPHAVFLLMAFAGMRIFTTFLDHDGRRLRNCTTDIATFLAAFVVVRFAIGYMFAGAAGFDMIGAYSDYTGAHWNREKIAIAATLCLTLIKGHAIALALLVGPCLIALVVPTQQRNEIDQKTLRLKAFSIAMLTVMLPLSIAFSVRIADGAPFVDTMRLHMRYYNVFFPVLAIALLLHVNANRALTRAGIVVAVALGLVAQSVVWASLRHFVPLPLDSPELRGIVANPNALTLAGISVAAVAWCFVWSPRIASRAYLMLVAPLMAINGLYWVNKDLSVRHANMLGDVAGKMTKAQLGENSKNVGFFGDVVSIYQAMFYAGDPGSFTYRLDDGAAVPDTLVVGAPVPGHLLPPGRLMPPNTEWIVVFGERSVPSHYSLSLQAEGWSLYRRLP